MLIYTYECNKCKRTFDVIQGIKDKTLEKHSDCTEGHTGLPDVCEGDIKRIIQTPTIIFKGKGWTPKKFKR